MFRNPEKYPTSKTSYNDQRIREDFMTNLDEEGFGRRTFLKQMATVASAAPLTPALMGAGSASAQTAPAHRGEETNHETERLAAYVAKLRYEDLPPAVVQPAKDCMSDTVAAIIYR